MANQFERGKDPKETLEIGRDVPKKKGDRFMASYGHKHERAGQEVEVEAISDEQRATQWITNKQDEHIERRMVDVKFVNETNLPKYKTFYLFVTSSDWCPGFWTLSL